MVPKTVGPLIIRRMWQFYASDNSYRCRISRIDLWRRLAWTSGVWFDLLIATKPKRTCSLALTDAGNLSIGTGLSFRFQTTTIKGCPHHKYTYHRAQLECKIQRDSLSQS